MNIKYNAYQTIKLGKNTTEKDLYELFGDTIETRDSKGNIITDYLKNKYGRNGMNNKQI
jgi:hypothetical protein